MQDMIFAFDAWENRAIADVRSLLDRQVPTDSEVDQRGIEWYALSSSIKTDPPREFLGHEGEVYDIVVTPDRKSFFSVGEDKTRRLWNLETGETLRVTPSDKIGKSYAVALSPDGQTLYTGGNNLCPLNISDDSFAQGKPLTVHKYGIRAIAVSPDNRYVASLCLQHQIHINSIEPNHEYANTLIAIPSQRCTRLDFSPDSKELYFSKRVGSGRNRSADQFVVWDIESKQQVFSGEPTSESHVFGPVDASGRWQLGRHW